VSHFIIVAAQNNTTHITAQDSLIFNQLANKSLQEKWHEKPLSEVVIKVTKYFEGTPYVASTLDIQGDEQLVVNLREMDCTTFVENVVALSRCLKAGKMSINDFTTLLKQIRYRNGIIDQYPSRLHYFTEWLTNNQSKGTISLVSEQLGDQPFDSKVGFMSSHPGSYAQLSNSDFVSRIKEAEATLSSLKLKYITTTHLPLVEKEIQDGDIIAFSTTIEGLDISHVAIAYHQNGRLCFIHASTTAGKVIVSQKSVFEYLTASKRNDGILVGRIRQ
jgi:hypothetical protein